MCKLLRQRCICRLLFQPAEGLFRCSQMVLLGIPLQFSEIFVALTCSYVLLSCPLYSELLPGFGGPLFLIHHNVVFLYMLNNKKLIYPSQIIKNCH